MSVMFETEASIVLSSIMLKYLKTNIDEYKNEFNYYVIENPNFSEIIDELESNIKYPWFPFKDNENKYILKIKKKYLAVVDYMTSGQSNIYLKRYTFENSTGYYINKINFYIKSNIDI